jgi:hypothetical protein
LPTHCGVDRALAFSLLPCSYLAFLLARRCEYEASARLVLQIWQHGGGSDVASDRFTHFLLLSLDSGSARSWGGSGPDNAVSVRALGCFSSALPPTPSNEHVFAAAASAAPAPVRLDAINCMDGDCPQTAVQMDKDFQDLCNIKFAASCSMIQSLNDVDRGYHTEFTKVSSFLSLVRQMANMATLDQQSPAEVQQQYRSNRAGRVIHPTPDRYLPDAD